MSPCGNPRYTALASSMPAALASSATLTFAGSSTGSVAPFTYTSFGASLPRSHASPPTSASAADPVTAEGMGFSPANRRAAAVSLPYT